MLVTCADMHPGSIEPHVKDSAAWGHVKFQPSSNASWPPNDCHPPPQGSVYSQGNRKILSYQKRPEKKTWAACLLSCILCNTWTLEMSQWKWSKSGYQFWKQNVNKSRVIQKTNHVAPLVHIIRHSMENTKHLPIKWSWTYLDLVKSLCGWLGCYGGYQRGAGKTLYCAHHPGS